MKQKKKIKCDLVKLLTPLSKLFLLKVTQPSSSNKPQVPALAKDKLPVACPCTSPHIIKTRIKTKFKMFEDIFSNQGFNHITEIILINLDVESLWKCRLVCKGLHQSIKSLEKNMKLKKNDFKIIRRIRRKKFLTHQNWNAVFNSIHQEDNFYRRRGLIDLLETYDNQDKNLKFNGPIDIESFLNTSKSLIKITTTNYLSSITVSQFLAF